jgi:urease subunit alpha
MGDINASIPTPQPSRYRRMFGAYGAAAPNLSYSFVAEKALAAGLGRSLKAKGLVRSLKAASNVVGLGKKDMIFNDACPEIEVDSQTYEVRADGELLTCQAATVLPLAQRYFLF